MWLVYEILYVIGLIFYMPKAFLRGRLPHRGWRMRLGVFSPALRESLNGRSTIWIHVVSVGEAIAAQPLIRAIKEAHPNEPIIISTVTPSGFAMASQRFGDFAQIIYFPLDLRSCVKRMLDAIQPRILILMESELWPTAIRLTKARKIPIAVVNGRISPRAFRRFCWIKPWLSGMLGRVDQFLMQSKIDGDRIIHLGAPSNRVHVVGSLKWEASLGTRPSSENLRAITSRIGLNSQEPVIVAGSTHRGEEEVVLGALLLLRESYPNLKLILAPRHLERLDEIETLVDQQGLQKVRMSQVSANEKWEVGLVDTFGVLSDYYGLASVVFIGGSLIPHGGQNPLEAASLGKPIIFGSSMYNFAEITQQLLNERAARQLASEAELCDALRELLSDGAVAGAMGKRARELVERFRGATQRTLEVIEPLLKAGSDLPKK